MIASRSNPDIPVELDLELLRNLRKVFDGRIPDSLDAESEKEALLGHTRAVLEKFSDNGIEIRGKDVLDLGAGDGKALALCVELGARSAIGIDLSDSGFQNLSQKLDSDVKDRITFIRGDIFETDFPDSAFDIVLSIASLEHFDRPDLLFGKYFDALKPGGHFFLNFGPLFRSCEGAHLFNTFKVPYIQNIFDKDVVHRLLLEDLKFVDPDHGDHTQNPYGDLNRWSLSQYEDFLFSHEWLQTIFYEKYYNWGYWWFVRNFKCYETFSQDDLFVSNVTIALRKTVET